MMLRITQQATIRSTLWQLNQKQVALAGLQEQLGTLRRINRPSDDPPGAVRALSLQTQIGQIERFQKNVAAIKNRLDVSASALQDVNDLLVSARQTVLAAANASVGQSEREVMASQVEDILRSIVRLGNTKHHGRYLFSGTATNTQPYEVTDLDSAAPVAYHGNDQSAEQFVDFQTKLEMNVPGSAVFGSDDGGGLFGLLSHIRHLLLNTDGLAESDQVQQLSDSIADLDAEQGKVLGAVGVLGSRSRTLEATDLQLGDETVALETLLSETQDADVTDLITRFSEHQNALQAALIAASDIIRPTLAQALQ